MQLCTKEMDTNTSKNKLINISKELQKALNFFQNYYLYLKRYLAIVNKMLILSICLQAHVKTQRHYYNFIAAVKCESDAQRNLVENGQQLEATAVATNIGKFTHSVTA